MNITIPKADFLRIRHLPNKSAYIALALREKFEREDKERQALVLAAAYRRSAQEEAEMTRDWDTLAGDGL